MAKAYDYPKLVAVGLCLVIFYCLWLIRGQKARIDVLTVCLFVLTLWASVQYVNIASPFMAPLIFPVLFLIYFLRKDFSKSLLFVSFLVCVYGWAQYFGWDIALYKHAKVFTGFTPDQRPFSFMGNPAFLGEFLVGVLPLAILKIPLLGFIAMALIVATGSRAALLGMAAGLIFYFIRQRGLRWRPVTVFGSIALILGCLLIMPWGVEQIGRSQTIKSRLLWWTVSASMIADHPLVGVGTEKFREEYPGAQGKYFQEHPNSTLKPYVPLTWTGNSPNILEEPHNQVLQIAAEYGIPAMFIFLAVLSLVFLFAPPAYAAGAFGMMTAGLFAFPLHNPATLILFGILAGATRMKEIHLPGRPFAFAGLAVSLLLLVTYIRLTCFGIGLYEAQAMNYQGKADAALSILDRADRFSPGDRWSTFERGRAKFIKKDYVGAYWCLQKCQRGFDSPNLYNALGATSKQMAFYQAKKQFYYPGVK